jgi:hypothetical protein|tara:strand:+ start:848 stop:1174 length:327 start_codon:yes stop_codon:yes gene_type:complete
MSDEMKQIHKEAIEITEDNMDIDTQLIDQLSRFAYRSFDQWDWKSKFKTKDKAIEFLLSHLENNRQLWVTTLRHNRSLLNQVRHIHTTKLKEYNYGKPSAKRKRKKLN